MKIFLFDSLQFLWNVKIKGLRNYISVTAVENLISLFNLCFEVDTNISTHVYFTVKFETQK